MHRPEDRVIKLTATVDTLRGTMLALGMAAARCEAKIDGTIFRNPVTEPVEYLQTLMVDLRGMAQEIQHIIDGKSTHYGVTMEYRRAQQRAQRAAGRN